MGRLTNLKPSVQMLQVQRVAVSASGDERIRGNSLQVIRRRILKRDGYRCRCARCARTDDVRHATIVDHVVPLWAGGSESDHNRQAIGAECHELKSAHETRCRMSGVWEPWAG